MIARLLTAPALILVLIPIPRFVQTRLVGMDLLHAGQDTVDRAFGHSHPVKTGAGLAYRFYDSGIKALLELVLDEESGSVKMARVVRASTNSRLPVVRLQGALTEASIRLDDSLQTVESKLGAPHKKERGKDRRIDYLYRAPAQPDGSLPTYRARYSFAGGKLTGVSIALGE